MAAQLLSGTAGAVGLQLLLSPASSSIVIRAACSFVGVAMPVYSTFKAVERKDTEESEGWLVYWSAFGVMSITEVFSDKVLSWFPYYYHAKLVLLIWMQYPNNQGARYVYRNVMRPFLLTHQVVLDRVYNTTKHELSNFMSQHGEDLNKLVAVVQKAAAAGYNAAARSSGGKPALLPPTLTLEGLPAPEVSPSATLTTPGGSQAATPAGDEAVAAALTSSWVHIQPAAQAAVQAAMEELAQPPSSTSPSAPPPGAQA